MLTVLQLLWNLVYKSYANIRSATFRLHAQASCNMALVFLNTVLSHFSLFDLFYLAGFRTLILSKNTQACTAFAFQLHLTCAIKLSEQPQPLTALFLDTGCLHRSKIAYVLCLVHNILYKIMGKAQIKGGSVFDR